MSYEATLEVLRAALLRAEGHAEVQRILQARDVVVPQYQKLFSQDALPNLTAEAFQGFLRYKNNLHWIGLHRSGPKICGDMDKLRAAMLTLADEGKPIAERLDEVVGSVSGMGRAIVTAVLLILRPDRYGVWNNISEGAMKQLRIWPSFERGMSFGDRYEIVNEIITRLSRDLEIDLWTLDALWWFLQTELTSETESGEEPSLEWSPDDEGLQRFGLEAHLHEFLRDNWDHTSLGKDWAMHSEPGNDEAGYKYPCGVGEIDLLVHHRTLPIWLVVELKRHQTSDATVGQVLRYMGWVTQKLAEKDEKVLGLIIAHSLDEKAKFALSLVPNVTAQTYLVDFKLSQVAEPLEGTEFELRSLDEMIAG